MAARLALTVLLVAHALVHLLGFSKWWPLLRIPRLRDPLMSSLVSSPANSRAFAVYWGLACLFLLAGAALHAASVRDWYQPALAGVIVSQVLILFVWRDAKFGTIANAIVLVPVILAAAQVRFVARCEQEASSLLSEAGAALRNPIRLEELAPLPAPVQRWLDRAGVVGKPRVQSLRLRQEGAIRTAPDAAWSPATAEQYFSIARPGFIWRVDTRMLGLLPVAGRDEYRAGKGTMRILAGALVTLVDADGPKIDSGAMQRYLGEMVWFPSAALSPNVDWSPIDGRAARATFSDHGRSVDAQFEFDALGRVVALRAQRYLGGGADAQLTPWLVSCSEWARFSGVEVPTRGEVVWQLPSGNFSYYRWHVLTVEYDPRALFSEDPSGVEAWKSATSSLGSVSSLRECELQATGKRTQKTAPGCASSTQISPP